MNLTVSGDDTKKSICASCGKKLTLFEGYVHPTLRRDVLLCWDCYETVWESVVQWGRFIAWNSFNPEAPDLTYIDNFPFPQKKIVGR